MTEVWEVFDRDPRGWRLPNDGVAKVEAPDDAAQWAALRWELETFVCEGEYHHGLERILSSYLGSLGGLTQPAAWISGFYGSGKSHLACVLDALWRDVRFPDGAAARGIARLPEDISDHLLALSTAGRREGGLWSATGTLGSAGGPSVRLALLQILFRAASLPEEYGAARFVLWLKEEGIYEPVCQHLIARGRELSAELRHLYVSPHLASALLQARPEFASSEAAARDALREQFPRQSDVSDDEMAAVMRRVMQSQSGAAGRLPCTLIVIDELEQWVGGSVDRAMAVQHVVERCSSGFGSRLLFVATGQSALPSSPELGRLQGRFTVTIALSDADVEKVVRRVVLHKRPDRTAELEAMLRQASGEIDRQLQSTPIGPATSDAGVLVPDYPLLPVRRRFFERVLRAAESSGVAGQLRTQLRVVLEAVQAIANKPLGHVIPGDALYEQLRPGLLRSGKLLPEVEQIINGQDDGTPDGKLRYRICALALLMGLLPEQGPSGGIPATADALADLLVEDLTAGRGRLKPEVDGQLATLAERGALIRIGDAYRLQTREGAEWEQAFRAAREQLLADGPRMDSGRRAALQRACEVALAGLRVLQGKSRLPREAKLHFGYEAPAQEGASVPVWIRDEWSCSRDDVKAAARAAGPTSSTVFVFLPRTAAEQLQAMLADHAAAAETLQQRGGRRGEEAISAEAAMRTREEEAKRRIVALTNVILDHAGVFLGGGAAVTGGGDGAPAVRFKLQVQQAVEQALPRLFPRFDDADDARWAAVGDRVVQGSGDPLSAVGYTGPIEQHQVCCAVLRACGGAGKKGLEIRRLLEGPPYGWPPDAITSALKLLVSSSHLTAWRDGAQLALRELSSTAIGPILFRAETVTLSAQQLIEIRALCQPIVGRVDPGDEAAEVGELLRKLRELAGEAGGYPPLPQPPATDLLRDIEQQVGAARLGALHAHLAELGRCFEVWSCSAREVRERLPRWELLQRLLQHARSLPAIQEVKQQADAILSGRQLLADPDPVPPLIQRLADELRQAVCAARDAFIEAYGQQIDGLLQNARFSRLSPQEQHALRARHDLLEEPQLELGAVGDLLSTLDSRPLGSWETRLAAIPGRIQQALLELERRSQPAAVAYHMPPATLTTVAELDGYLAAVREAIAEELRAGKSVVV